MPTEADTCRTFVLPKIYAAGWTDDQIFEQKAITDGRVVMAGDTPHRRPKKKPDYLLYLTRDLPLAVIEAKAEHETAGKGLQQAKDYADILDLKFAYATNGKEIIEFDYLTGVERMVDSFPAPDDLWRRLRKDKGLKKEEAAERFLSPFYHLSDRSPRYYQRVAIHRTVQAILNGKKRVLLTMATGTGKTVVAFQLCWQLWSSRWNCDNEYRCPKILYLADRNILIDDPKDKTFTPFGDARWKIENGKISKGREMYFSTYQAIAEDERRPGLYKQYAPDFFDLIIIDECHRGSARDKSSWREILEYFSPAHQVGMTATPKRQDNVDTYAYFGNPIYTYSLRQGIDDGFLAPYRVHRVVTSFDATGWRPSAGDVDRYGRKIPDEEYQTKDFERAVALKARTTAIAKYVTDFLKKSDRFAKTIVFCVDQEHADEMRRELNNLNADLVKRYPDYVCRVTSDEGDIGKGHLSNFQDLERESPVILTSSQLLTTGVDAPTCKNVVLARVINSMVEFKQIIGRGTRLREDYGKMYFNILDFTQSTRLFADPEFDGDPELIDEEEIDVEGGSTGGGDGGGTGGGHEGGDDDDGGGDGGPGGGGGGKREKYYYDGGQVEIAAHLVYELDADGNQLRIVKYTDYAADKVRTLYRDAEEMRVHWSDPVERNEIIENLAERGIDFDQLATTSNQPLADPFDLLCHLAFDAPLRTRAERAKALRSERKDFFDQFGLDAREILNLLLDKYTEFGTAQFMIPDILEIPPLSDKGNLIEIAKRFGGVQQLREAITSLQTLLYAA